MFERKIKSEYLKLSQIVYGGVFYLQLKNYKLKEVLDSKFDKVTDMLLSKQGNNNFYAYKNAETGFVGNVFDNGKNIVIAYRGTERLGLGENVSDIYAFMLDVSTDLNLMTGNYDPQFRDAWDFYKEVRNQNPNRKIVIVGQSLGGALAQIVAAKEFTVNRKKVETYTFNAPGCSHLLDLYDCNTDFSYSFITNYSVMNDWCGMFGEHLGQRFLILPIRISKIDSDATADILNNILLTTHEGIFDYTEAAMKKVIRKPKNFNQQEGLALWYFDKNNPLKDYPYISDYMQQKMPQFDYTANSIMQKTEQFFRENLPVEVQNSPVAVAIKNATDSFISSSNEQMIKIANSMNNSTLAVAMKLLDSVTSKLSLSTYNKAEDIVKSYEKHFGF